MGDEWHDFTTAGFCMQISDVFSPVSGVTPFYSVESGAFEQCLSDGKFIHALPYHAVFQFQISSMPTITVVNQTFMHAMCMGDAIPKGIVLAEVVMFAKL